jgi:hypothetical protein
MLTDPSQRKPDLPKMIDVEKGMTTQDLVSRNPGQAERWHQQPTLEWMLVCQLWCSSSYQVVGYNVVKCNLNTGAWNAAMPTCEAERLVVSVSAANDDAAKPAKETVKVTKPPKKQKKEKKQKKVKAPKDPAAKKKKKLAKACKKGNKTACGKLDKLKKEKMAENDNRTDDFDFVLPDFTEQCGPRGNSKCEKREMRKFCALHPTNFFC